MSSSRVACPFCGKSFKRLNSHLPKCKMASVSLTTPSLFTQPAQQDITGKSRKTLTSIKTENILSSTCSPILSTPSPNTMKTKKASSSSSRSLTTTKSKTPSASSPSAVTSTTAMKKQTLIVSKDCLDKVPAQISNKTNATTTPAKLTEADPAKATVNSKPKALVNTAKLKATTGATGDQVRPKPKAASKKVSLRKQIEQSTQTDQAAARLSHDAFPETQSNVKPFWEKGRVKSGKENLELSVSSRPRPSIQDHTRSTEELPSKTNSPDQNPSITSNLNKDLCSKTRNQGALNDSSSMLDLVQTSTSDRLYNKSSGSLMVNLGQTKNLVLNCSSVTAGKLATVANSPQSPTMKSQANKASHMLKLNETVLPESNIPFCSLTDLTSSSSDFSFTTSVKPQQSGDTGSHCPSLPLYVPLISPRPLSPSLFSVPSPPSMYFLPPQSPMPSWTPQRGKVGMEAVLENILPYQMIGLKMASSPCCLTGPVLLGLMLHASTPFTPRLPPSHPPALSGPPFAFLSVLRERSNSATANECRTWERVPTNTRKYVPEQKTKGALSLGDVRLKELPGWFATRDCCNPRQGIRNLKRGWQWYYRRFLDVKVGVSGAVIVLAGCCFLSYTWRCPHINVKVAGGSTTKVC
ncbi:hypothetical protein UPYG_G00136900 [Umbra pygmaea]|uniref:ATP synthase subunit f, mitochondrial n=1 Tax=Umbra pygmaea TaxID=75934 RepID=A0ABD0WYS9_UMBPY